MRPRRTRIEDLRREELIAAAHRVFMAHGMGGLTMARIGAEAGMSPGLLSYYFKGKDEVLFGMVRYNNRILAQDVAARLARATTRWQRFLAIVDGNFPGDTFNATVAAAWLSVVAASPGNARFARLQRLFYRRLASNLGSVFRGPCDGAEVRALTFLVGSTIDGLWLRKSVDPGLARDAAAGVVVDAVRARLSPAVLSALQRASDQDAGALAKRR